jgi:hypothetical protein
MSSSPTQDNLLSIVTGTYMLLSALGWRNVLQIRPQLDAGDEYSLEEANTSSV